MMNKAYILIETAMGRSREVALALQKCEWVEFVERVTGPYDVVVMAQGHLRDIDDVINDGLRPIEGVIRAVVCPVSTIVQGGVPALVH
jgi:hypothetical protein